MATYAIGDIQGCFNSLEKLLREINFHPDKDTLWSTGDLVNRGPQSLEALRFYKSLGDKHKMVLGNHDLHLIALHYRTRRSQSDDTLDPILTAPDGEELINWLRHRPLLIYDSSLNYVMTHAGIAPAWSLEKAQALAREVEIILQSASPESLLQNMYGNTSDEWRDELTGIERWHCIINYFTRMRFCYSDGRLDFAYKGGIAGKSSQVIPWFEVESRVNASVNIIFGHWSALGGKVNLPHLFPLDTGCVWGGCLTAMRLEDNNRFSVAC
jgi:bis(5'-nucleosyl)-tetraphosphatase (symmetrical)